MTKAMEDLQEILGRFKEEGMNVYLFFCISKILMWIVVGYVFILVFVVEEDFPIQTFRIGHKKKQTQQEARREGSSTRLILFGHLSYIIGSALLYLFTPDFERLMSSLVFEE